MALSKKERRIRRATKDAQFWYEIEVKSLNYWLEGVVRPRRYSVRSGYGKFNRKTQW